MLSPENHAVKRICRSDFLPNVFAIARAIVIAEWEHPSITEFTLNDPEQLRDRSAFGAITQITIPLMISHTELDRPDAILQADRVNNALCTASHCLTYAVFKDHSHARRCIQLERPIIRRRGRC